MATYLVTGGAGFVGSHIVDRLLDNPSNIVVVVDNLVTGSRDNVHERAHFHEMSIGSPDMLDIFMQYKPDYVFHIAAQIDVRTSVTDPIFDAQTNVMGTLNVLELCRRFEVKKILFSSSGGAIYSSSELPAHEMCMEDPISPYAINKLMIDKYLQYYYCMWGMKYISLRFSNVYGPRQNSRGAAGVIAIFIDSFLDSRSPVIFGSGKQTRDYVYVHDIVDLAMLSMKSKEVGIFNAGTCKETSLNGLVDQMKQAGGFESISVEYVSAKKGEVMRSALDCRKSMKTFNWKPRHTLAEGLSETIEWFREHGRTSKG